MDFWKEKNVYTEWVYVLDVHCCATSVNEAYCRLELCGLNLGRHLVPVGPFSIAM